MLLFIETNSGILQYDMWNVKPTEDNPMLFDGAGGYKGMSWSELKQRIAKGCLKMGCQGISYPL